MNSTLLNVLDTEPVVYVEFNTKKGSTRTMRCTRLLSAIPVNQHTGIATEKYQHDTICCVYDLDIKEWRAFRWDSILKWEKS